MNNPICISTGAVYKFSEDMNEEIQMLEKFSPDGVELCFADSQHLLDFKITEGNLSYLRELKAVSIHAPWIGIRYGKNQRSEDVLKAIGDLYCFVNARNVVFHADFIDDFGIFENYKPDCSIENNDWKHPFANTVLETEFLLAENKNIKFTFDFAHVLTMNSSDAPVYVEKFNDRIIQIHFSYHGRELSDHWFLHKHDSKEMQELLECLKPLNVPVILECVAADKNELPLIKKEMEYVREIFS